MNMAADQKTSGTQDRILDAAETLFIQLGYAATSHRAIAHRAGVNLAATNYHFGSKKGLLAAVIHRQIEPELDPEQLNWRFHLMIGSMLHLLMFSTPIVTQGSDEPFRDAIEHLIDYSIAGLSQGE